MNLSNISRIDDIPTYQYTVFVTRHSYSKLGLQIYASSDEEARKEAVEIATGLTFPELKTDNGIIFVSPYSDAEYSVEIPMSSKKRLSQTAIKKLYDEKEKLESQPSSHVKKHPVEKSSDEIISILYDALLFYVDGKNYEEEDIEYINSSQCNGDTIFVEHDFGNTAIDALKECALFEV